MNSLLIFDHAILYIIYNDMIKIGYIYIYINTGIHINIILR